MRKFKWLFVLLVFFQSCNSSAGNSDEDFREFLVRFSTDHKLQSERIKFPLRKVSLADDLASKKETSIGAAEWTNQNLFYGRGCEDIYPQIYDNFQMQSDDSGERVLAWRGIENGIAEFYYFQKIKGKWYLVKVDDLST